MTDDVYQRGTLRDDLYRCDIELARMRREREIASMTVGDRFELMHDVGPKLRPRGSRVGRILEDLGDCWRIQFDGSATNSRVILKTFIRAER